MRQCGHLMLRALVTSGHQWSLVARVISLGSVAWHNTGGTTSHHSHTQSASLLLTGPVGIFTPSPVLCQSGLVSGPSSQSRDEKL